MSTDRLTSLARDLRTIEYLSRYDNDLDRQTLLAQAVNLGGDPLMPGGLAMVALAGVANLEQYAHKLDTAEQVAQAKAFRLGLELDDVWPAIDDDDDWEPPLQTLCFWSESWRRERGAERDATGRPSELTDFRPTVNSEASFLRNSLDWAWDNEIHFDDFADDVRKAKARLEALLTEGSRAVARGVPCMYDECRGKRLIRTTIAVRDPDTKEKTWVLTDWHCPNCERSYSEKQYESHVYAAIHRDRSVVLEVLDPETGDWVPDVWCDPELAAKRVGRPGSTVRVWLHRGEVAGICAVGDDARKKPRRLVRMADVQARHQLAVLRWEQRQAAIATRLANSVNVARV